MRYWYEGFLGLRYLRASPKRGFVSLIAGIAIIGLALGVAVLIVVLSVMNGFEEELRTRILSLTAHATISGLEGRIADWRPQIDQARALSRRSRRRALYRRAGHDDPRRTSPPGFSCAACCRTRSDASPT